MPMTASQTSIQEIVAQVSSRRPLPGQTPAQRQQTNLVYLKSMHRSMSEADPKDEEAVSELGRQIARLQSETSSPET